MAAKLPLASKYREYDGNAGLTSTGKAGETQLEPFRPPRLTDVTAPPSTRWPNAPMAW